jgi:hypothetical protein
MSRKGEPLLMNKKTRDAALVLLPLLVFLTGPPAARADEHIVSELKRSYMGRTYPVQPSEVWVGGDKVYIRDGAVVLISRHDLKKRWIILPGRKKYLEEPLAAPRGGREPANNVRIQEYGFNYEPAFVWTVRETAETAAVNGLSCRKIVARGDAEYAEEIREMWVTSEAPIDIKAYYERVVKPNLDGPWTKIYQNREDLRNGVVMKSRTTSEPAIAPASVTETIVLKIEKAAPPEKIYEIPEGLRKVATRAELYAR